MDYPLRLRSRSICFVHFTFFLESQKLCTQGDSVLHSFLAKVTAATGLRVVRASTLVVDRREIDFLVESDQGKILKKLTFTAFQLDVQHKRDVLYWKIEQFHLLCFY